MKTSHKLRALATAVFTALLLSPASVALAHNGVQDYDSPTWSAGLLFGSIVFVFIIFALAIAAFVLWVVMLIDALQRKNWQDETQKNVWVVSLIVSFFFGAYGIVALVYYFVIRRSLGKGGKVQEAVVVAQAPATDSSTAGKKGKK